jgi:hypothetical protein
MTVTRTLVLLFALLALAAAVPPLRNTTVLLPVPEYDYDDDNDNNITLDKETVVHVQVSPPEEELDLAGVYMHQASRGIQSMLKSGTHILDPFVDFFRELFAHIQPAPPPLPSKDDRRKLYII